MSAVGRIVARSMLARHAGNFFRTPHLQSSVNRVAFRHEVRSQTGTAARGRRRGRGGAGDADDPQRAPTKRTASQSKGAPRKSKRGYLDGQMLIAMPSMGDERFARSVIYVCAHSAEGAMGIMVNQPAANISFPDLLVQLDVIPAADLIQLPPGAGVQVLKGGPVDTQRGFVLHSSDFFIENSTLADRRGHLSHRDARHPQGDRPRRRGRAARFSRSAMPAGRPVSWRTKSSITAGCIAPPIPN